MEENILNLIKSNKYSVLGEGFISKSYRLIINSKKYILLQGQIKDSYKCYSKSFYSINFLLNNGKPLIKSIKIPFNEINLIKPNPNNEFFKFGGLIYIEIEGLIFYEKYFDKINIEKITDSISNFLKELYRIPINENDIKEIRLKNLKKYTKDFKLISNYFKENNINCDRFKNLENEYIDYIHKFEDFHYIHGDLWEENMIISEDYQNLIGVVDFDEFGISDSAKDYASLLDFGFEFIYKLIDKNKDIIKSKEEFIKRIKMYQKLIEIEDFAYILRDKNLFHKLPFKLKNLEKLDLITFS